MEIDQFLRGTNCIDFGPKGLVITQKYPDNGDVDSSLSKFGLKNRNISHYRFFIHVYYKFHAYNLLTFNILSVRDICEPLCR